MEAQVAIGRLEAMVGIAAALAIPHAAMAQPAPRVRRVVVYAQAPELRDGIVGTLVGRRGSVAYGPDFSAMWRQVGGYVDRVLRGVKVNDPPFERPSKFSLIVNLKTAKDIGVGLPQSLVLRADEVIQ